MNPKSGLIRSYTVGVEDDHGIYFLVYVVAIHPEDAERRVRYILNLEAARPIGVTEL